MICNELVVPVFLLRRPALGDASGGAVGWLLLTIRRIAIFVIVLAAFAYHEAIGDRYPLASIGLLSFCAVAQFAPALVAGLFWRGAHRHGAVAGMAGGTLVWAYALLLPSLSEAGWLSPTSVLGIGWLPSVLATLDPLTNGMVWSLLVNVALLAGVSLLSRQRERDRQQADIFVTGEIQVAPRDAGHAATFDDLKSLAARYPRRRSGGTGLCRRGRLSRQGSRRLHRASAERRHRCRLGPDRRRRRTAPALGDDRGDARHSQRGVAGDPVQSRSVAGDA